jgi:hypothetical protein
MRPLPVGRPATLLRALAALAACTAFPACGGSDFSQGDDTAEGTAADAAAQTGGQEASTGDASGDASSDAGPGEHAPMGDPCAQVTCSTPPASHCLDGQTLAVYASSGTCSGGTCRYAQSTEPCSGGCKNGACAGDLCAGMTCSTPPANRCLDAQTLAVFPPSGTCNGGACSYTPSMQSCQGGCANGACITASCDPVTCTSPPVDVCADANTLTAYSPQGKCSAGACTYASLMVQCPAGCMNGHCKNDPCNGVICTTPPANACADASTLTSYASQGTCNAGVCSYSATMTSCVFGCSNGQCIGDPCTWVTCTTPPANVCLSPSTLEVYSPKGTCSGGMCSYTASTTGCNSPPPDTCLDANTLAKYSGVISGSCSNGACVYTPYKEVCTYGCARGQCTQNYLNILSYGLLAMGDSPIVFVTGPTGLINGPTLLNGSVMLSVPAGQYTVTASDFMSYNAAGLDYGDYYATLTSNSQTYTVYSGQTTEADVYYTNTATAFSFLFYVGAGGHAASQGVAVKRGSSVTLQLDLASPAGGYLVTMGVNGLPAGVTATYTCNGLTGQSSCATVENSSVDVVLTAAASAAPGTYLIEVTGTGQGTSGNGAAYATVQVE